MADMMSSYYANFVKKGNPNGEGLTKWKQSTYATEGSFIRWFEGQAENVSATPYPLRDELNRKTVMEIYGITDADLQKEKGQYR